MIAGIGASAPLRLIRAPPRSARGTYQRHYDPARCPAQHSIGHYSMSGGCRILVVACEQIRVEFPHRQLKLREHLLLTHS